MVNECRKNIGEILGKTPKEPSLLRVHISYFVWQTAEVSERARTSFQILRSIIEKTMARVIVVLVLHMRVCLVLVAKFEGLR